MNKIVIIIIIGAIVNGFLIVAHTQVGGDNSETDGLPSENVSNFTFGTRGFDEFSSIIETSNGSYVLAGSSNDKAWLLETNDHGDEVWSRTYFGEGIQEDKAVSLINAEDGGYAVAGQTYVAADSNVDSWLMKIDSEGENIWEKTFGTENRDEIYSLIQTKDGGFVLIGQKEVENGIDAWLLKTDGQGNKLWSRTYGGPDYDSSVWDEAWSVIETEDGGLVFCGQKQNPDNGDVDAWLLKTNSSGRKIWSKTYDVKGWGEAFEVVQTSDGGFAIAGQTHFFEEGGIDSWLLRTDESGNRLWTKDYKTVGWDRISSLAKTDDGGFVMAGELQYKENDAGSIVKPWLLRANESGEELWSKTFGGSHYGSEVWDKIEMVIQTSDGEFAMVGGSTTSDNRRLDGWLLKTNNFEN